MEFCPEFAVFQSALQLVQKQTNDSLPTLSKEASYHFMKVIKTAVDEICLGLEQDISVDESETWNQKLHLICFYAVIENNYRVPEEKKSGQVPVCSDLDILSKMLPRFSPQFYFEILKTCSWTYLFVECLDYIDKGTASRLLCDFLKHSEDDNTKVIAIVTDKILCSCLCLPVTMETMSTLMKSVNTERRYIQILFPENVAEDENETEISKSKTVAGFKTECDDNKYIGATFWDYFVSENPNVIVQILDYFDRYLVNVENDKANILKGDMIMKTINIDNFHASKMGEMIGKIFLFWYIHASGSGRQEEDGIKDLWFVNNFFVSKDMDSEDENCTRGRQVLSYRFNLCLIEKIGNTRYKEQICQIVKRSVKLFFNCSTSDLNKQQLSLRSDMCVLRTRKENLLVKTAMLIRMVKNTLTDMSDKLVEWFPTDSGCLVSDDSLVLSKDWSSDVTLEALLWRIREKLFFYEDYVQTLLSERCWSLWKSESIYEVLRQSPNLISKKSQLLKAIQILAFLLNYPSCTTVPLMREVLCMSFNEMSVSDKDAVISTTYSDVAMDMSWLLGATESQSLHLQITNTFNKVTADMIPQVVTEVFLHCLKDPVSVIKAALEMCVKNQDQAVNFAQILCSLPVTCNTTHEENHHGHCLIVTLIDRYVRETRLTDKEEKHFITFITILMKRFIKEQTTVLSPTDLANLSLLEAVDYNNFSSSSYPIKCSFALSVLMAAFECGINTSCDWTGSNFEPVVLLVNLANILHECTDIWGDEYLIVSVTSDDEDQGDSSVTMVTGQQKILMKEKVLTCMEMLVNMMLTGMILENETVHWFQAVTEDLNWVVKVTLAKYLYKLGHIQAMSDWFKMFEELMTNKGDNLTSVLLLACTDVRFIEEMDWTSRGDNSVSNKGDNFQSDGIDGVSVVQYDNLITALVQIVPNQLIGELQRCIHAVEMLVQKCLVSVCYRSTAMTAVPIIDLTSVQPILYISQILRDVILTLNYVQGERSSMLKHVLQCYVTVMKTKCSQDFETAELCLFTLTQVFHHVCDLTEHLPQDCVDSGLVLLLHILTKVKDISIAATTPTKMMVKDKKSAKDSSTSSSANGKLNLKFVKNLENAMKISVGRLSDSFDEKHMLMKKLIGPNC